MRNFTVNLVCGVVALVGFAGSASASATIDLLWDVNGTNTISGAELTGANLTLNVVLTAGPGNSDGAGISVDYSDLLGLSSVSAFASTTGTAPLNVNLGTTTNNAGAGLVNNINSVCLGLNCLLNGQTFLLGTITFNSITGAPGSYTISPYIDTVIGTDGVLDGFGSDIASTTTFNSAFAIVPVPEPGTISLLGMGLAGLYAVGRRSSRKR